MGEEQGRGQRSVRIKKKRNMGEGVRGGDGADAGGDLQASGAQRGTTRIGVAMTNREGVIFEYPE